MRRARSTPGPSLGKNTAGAVSRQRASTIQTVSMRSTSIVIDSATENGDSGVATKTFQLNLGVRWLRIPHRLVGPMTTGAGHSPLAPASRHRDLPGFVGMGCRDDPARNGRRRLRRPADGWAPADSRSLPGVVAEPTSPAVLGVDETSRSTAPAERSISLVAVTRTTLSWRVSSRKWAMADRAGFRGVLCGSGQRTGRSGRGRAHTRCAASCWGRRL